MSNLTLPGARAQVVEGGLFARAWYQFFNAVAQKLNNSTPLTIPGPYANDAAAAAGGVAIGSLYREADGTPRVRIA